MVFRCHRAGEVDRSAGDMGVHVDPTGENHHASRIDGAATFEVSDKSAVVADVQITDFTVDAVCRVVNFPARDAEHAMPLLCKTLVDCRVESSRRGEDRSPKKPMNRMSDARENHLNLSVEHGRLLTHPVRFLCDRLVDSTDDFFVSRIG